MFRGHVCLQSLGGKNLILFLHYYNVRSYLFICSIFDYTIQLHNYVYIVDQGKWRELRGFWEL